MIEITPEYLASQGLSETFPQRFWAKVQKTDSCWLWTACAFFNGYGAIGRGVNHKIIKAHIASWILHHGSIPAGMCVLHNCPGGDNRACVNPDHLWIGTQADNVHDFHKKGRAIIIRGEAHSNHKLTWEKARQAREEHASGSSIRTLAARFGVNPKTMLFCLRMKTWKLP